MEDSARGLPRLLGPDRDDDLEERLMAVATPRATLSGWATVDLDRAEEEVAGTVAELGSPTSTAVPGDRHLGARARLLSFVDGLRIVLLEPATEGRLAAALARHGEGFAVRYLEVDAGAVERARRAGFVVSAEGRGPFGAERLVAGPRDGPFLALIGFD